MLSIVAVASPAVLAAALCLYELDVRSLWLDEAATFSIASQHGAAFGSALARDGGNMLGYYALMHVLVDAFGHSPAVLRIPSAIAAGIGAGLVALLCLRLWDRLVAWAAGLLFAVSLTLVYWGQDARSYAVMIALIAGSFLALVALLEPGATWRAWATYVVITVAAVYAGLEAALVIPAQLIVVAVRGRSRLAGFLAAVLVTSACCAPLAVLAAGRGSSQLFWVPAPSLRTAKQVLQAITSSGLQPGYYTSTGDALLILTVILVTFGAVKVGVELRHHRPRVWGGLLAVTWLVVPVLLTLLISLAGHSVFQARYALVSLPAAAILVAWTLQAATLGRPLAAALLVTVVVLRGLALAPSYGASTEQWKTAAEYVAAGAQAGDCIAFYPLDSRMPFEYYEGPGQRLPFPVLPSLRWGVIRPYVEDYAALSRGQIASLAGTGGGRCDRMWLVWSHEGHLGGPPVSAANFERLGRLRSELARRYHVRSVRTFGRASPVSVELFKAAA